MGYRVNSISDQKVHGLASEKYI